MILVRVVLQTKWGAANEVARAASEAAEEMREEMGVGRVRILTDLSGPYHTVVEEIELESLAAWESGREKMFSHPAFLKSMERMEGLVESGQQEFYTIEYAS